MNLPRGCRTIRQVLSGLANVRSAVPLPRGRFIKREHKPYEDWPMWRYKLAHARFVLVNWLCSEELRISLYLLAGAMFLSSAVLSACS